MIENKYILRCRSHIVGNHPGLLFVRLALRLVCAFFLTQATYEQPLLSCPANGRLLTNA
jgi:hypothetical protein